MRFVCPSDVLAQNASLGFDIDGQKLFGVRREGTAYFYVNRCPHRRVPLEWKPDHFLDQSTSLIQCATHGALFLIETGECVSGPCVGQSLIVLPSREDEKGLWVQI
ncbi:MULTISPECIES: Rieske (2Fe-2S) protein [Pseudomonas]|uniref:Ferredoxin subunit of nitrite reductase or a ring-hydroxylating dioxygenase n=1 Tax=Pseudomonas palleroniana TaxID=191390 RepID=A0A1H5B4X9_9PSED|nr:MULTISPECIES: Rieske 2Fe-2S domain-containing protein [Pseudomonas]KAB0567613.1 Rieske 2Fe-2S domain-containing protein [Pseudomonas palleroniana]MBM9488113.1 Rieske 2Fe-2S domain-containing protein [Pseudomonas sp. ICBG1301]NCE84246.1 Rieske (2Fe-2S) protein [Pseudomonas sp. Q1]PTC24438.1 Rieske (2Fe-2S) protein [Pseudomonas palleroniana]SED49308.1 Ferredoxin subunit of nitrite reductase or a ring-hydroxylating dioxygenase [Pseudomonas palleroniana]